MTEAIEAPRDQPLSPAEISDRGHQTVDRAAAKLTPGRKRLALILTGLKRGFANTALAFGILITAGCGNISNPFSGRDQEQAAAATPTAKATETPITTPIKTATPELSPTIAARLERYKNPEYNLFRQSWERSQTIGVYTGETVGSPEFNFLNQIWEPVEKNAGQLSGNGKQEFITPNGTYFQIIPVAVREIPKGDSRTVFTFGPRTDLSLGADFSVRINRIESVRDLGRVGRGVSETDPRLNIILDTYRKSVRDHEGSHARSLLMGVHDFLAAKGLPKQPLKVDSQEKMKLVQTMMEENKQLNEKLGPLLEFIPHVYDYLDLTDGLEKAGLTVKLVDKQVGVGGKLETMKIPVAVDKSSGKEFFVFDRVDIVAIANFMNRWGLDKAWLNMNKDVAVFDLDPRMLRDFTDLYKTKISSGSTKLAPEATPVTVNTPANEAKEDTTTTENGVMIKKYIMTTASGRENVRACTGGGLIPGEFNFKAGEKVFQYSYEKDKGVYVFTENQPNGVSYVAYAFYNDFSTHTAIENAVKSLKPGDSVHLGSVKNGDSCSNSLVSLKLNGNEFITPK